LVNDQVGPIASAVLLGAVAGLRTQLPLALLARAANDGRFAAAAEPPLALLRSPWTQRVTSIAAIAELIGDKLPTTPSRLDPGPLAGRFLFGALAGAAVMANSRRSPLSGALLGAAAACLGALCGYYLRRRLGQLTSIPDPLLGLAEDGVAVTLGIAALRDNRQ
jgi:uncharacterized membrane protein